MPNLLSEQINNFSSNVEILSKDSITINNVIEILLFDMVITSDKKMESE